MAKKPYIISTTLFSLMQNWSSRSYAEIPNKDYFDNMAINFKTKLSNYFDDVILVNEDAYNDGMKSLADNSSFPVISLDRNFINLESNNIIGNIELTRAVNPNFDYIGLVKRGFSIPFEKQVDVIRQNTQTNNLCILDDVLFSGGTVLEIIDKLKPYNLNIKSISANIAMQNGLDLMKEKNINAQANYIFKNAIDEVCLRDFIPGSPLSGRTVHDENNLDSKQAGVPYLLPYGDICKWASIPEKHAIDFSIFCLDQAIDMWKETSKATKHNIYTIELPRPIFKVNENMPIIDHLEQVKTQVVAKQKNNVKVSCKNYII